MNVKETLEIKNFFSIKDFKWEVKGFNIITGGMASGKSLALKLLYFCEDIFQQTVFQTTISKNMFQEHDFFRKLEENFNQIFFSGNPESDYSSTIIKYIYEYNSEQISNELLFDSDNKKNIVFELSAKWDANKKHFCWTSEYIKKNLPAWQAHLQDLNTPEMAKSIRNSIFESIKSDFMNALPLGAIFIPASRAIAALSDRIKSQDVFINNFFDLKDFALSFNNISNNYINKILKIKNIFLDDQKQPIIELPDGRKITPLQLASGQQELLYLLILISDLNRAGMEFSSQYSVFIEEPSAHLFPQEQKMTMEFLAKSFSELQKHGYRFIISTHSPYVLNVINNLLEKERLLNKIKPSGKENELRNKLLNLPFPGLSVNEVAAYMIESDGCVNSMISTGDDEQYIYSSVIDKIDDVISNDVNELLNIAEAINK